QFSSPDFSGLDQSSVPSVDSSAVYFSFSTESNDFLAKYSLNGNNVWTLQMPHTNRLEPRTAYRVAFRNEGVYFAGSITSPTSIDRAFIGEVDSSSSLIFFGLNPPWSFMAL